MCKQQNNTKFEQITLFCIDNFKENGEVSYAQH